MTCYWPGVLNHSTFKMPCVPLLQANQWKEPQPYSHLSVYTRNVKLLAQSRQFTRFPQPQNKRNWIFSQFQGVLKCRLFHALCLAQQCGVFGGKKECIFILSEKTGAGDELGWDFLDLVRKGRLSFTGRLWFIRKTLPTHLNPNFLETILCISPSCVFLPPGFCKLKTKDYRTTEAKSAPFMNPKTFVKWALSWMVAFKIDFRKEVDPVCKHDPPMLVKWDDSIQLRSCENKR